MEKSGIVGAVASNNIFVESLTCYRAWVGSVYYTRSSGYTGVLWSFVAIRRPDWLSAKLRAAKVGTPFASVKIYTPSGGVVALMNAVLGAYGAAVWRDPKHSKPSGALEMVTYNCYPLLVGNAGVLPSYDWWQLNA